MIFSLGITSLLLGTQIQDASARIRQSKIKHQIIGGSTQATRRMNEAFRIHLLWDEPGDGEDGDYNHSEYCMEAQAMSCDSDSSEEETLCLGDKIETDKCGKTSGHQIMYFDSGKIKVDDDVTGQTYCLSVTSLEKGRKAQLRDCDSSSYYSNWLWDDRDTGGRITPKDGPE
eukprot:CAMPEP_0183296548 /NCGR_PEP_ID=MMETSP0160_2-20130417/4052_1 /TAXON_ID=2839 ORGANISM="Odontella Sinensis, Strain Grunow 1884" /NCGR_SAMPLE_ID=MMETSP0160_2 /ASSEMBLY_ACC=CAM_ASM_000250 /LENGTH=171 /DNA_ID=CAMNT_0025458169 /DNA_START=53 /DNA_END=565 /DNA_ORIENTATION=+